MKESTISDRLSSDNETNEMFFQNSLSVAFDLKWLTIENQEVINSK